MESPCCGDWNKCNTMMRIGGEALRGKRVFAAAPYGVQYDSEQ